MEEEEKLLPEGSPENNPKSGDAEEIDPENANPEDPLSKKKKVKKKDDEDDDEEPTKSVSIWKLLIGNSKSKEIMLMGLGTVASFLQGTAFPSLSVIFGNMSDSIMNSTLASQHNETIIEYNRTVGNYELDKIYIENIKASPDLNDVDIQTSYIESYLLPEEFHEEISPSHAEFSSNLSFFSIYSVLIGLIALLSSVIHKVSWEVSSSGQSERREEGFYQNVLHQDQEFFDKNKKQNIAKTFSSHLKQVEHGTGTQFSEIIHKLTAFFSGAAVALQKSWPFALVLLAVIPILSIKSAFNAKFGHQENRKKIDYKRSGKHSLQVFSAIRTVAAFGAEPKEIEKYKSDLKDDLHDELHHYNCLGLGYALSNFFTYAAYALSFWTAANILAAANITAGTIYTILLSMMVGASNLGRALHNIANVVTAKGSAAAIEEVVKKGEQLETQSKDGLIIDKFEGAIVFNNVNFQYPVVGDKAPETVFALTNINMNIEPQQIIGIVGTRKSGKSTIIKLLERFYEPNEGFISIDGHPIQTLNLPHLRKRIGIVPKTPFLFYGTIKENIGCGKLGSSDDEIIQASKNAFADEFISALPNGYDTMLEEEESEFVLSIEQKQLISIARTLLQSPDIMILDQPLINDQIYPNATQALGNACEGRTTIIISDRLSKIQAHQIYVFNAGTIAEVGTVEDLMEADGLYASLLAEELLMSSIEEMSTEADLKKEETEEEAHKKHSKQAEDKIQQPEKSELEQEVEKLGLDVPTPMEILKLNQPESFSVILASIGAIISGFVLPMYAVLYAEFFNTFTKSGEELMNYANYYTIMFLVLAVVSGLANGIQVSFAAKAGETLLMRLKINAFSGIIRQSISWFEEKDHSPEILAKRLAIDAELVRGAGIDLLCNFLTAFTTILVSCLVIIYSSWKIGLVVLVVAYPFLLVTGFKQTVGKHEAMKVKKLIGGPISAEKIMENCVQNIECIQQLGLEDYFYERYTKAKEKEDEWNAFKAQVLSCSKLAFAQSGIFFVYSGVFGIGSWVMSIGLIDGTSLFRIFFSTIFCANGIGSLVASIVDHRKGQLAAAIVLNFAKIQSTIDPFRMIGKTPRIAGELVVSDAHFKHPTDEALMADGLSFKAEKKRILAIAGPPSSGKALIFDMYERFYDVASGRFLIDGYDVRDLKLQHLRRSIGLVTQNPFFFSATIRYNITYGFGGPGEIIPEEKIIQAAKLARIHDFILTLPQRYETLIGPKGFKLSLRQKQRLAFARALIRNPTILLVDEPKIYNEPEESQKMAEDVLDVACEDRTCIIIARSKYVLQHSDCVAFMGNGKVMEMGSPAEILATKGIEYHLRQRP